MHHAVARTVRFDENYYSSTPAWRLSEDDESSDSPDQRTFGARCDAVDGTLRDGCEIFVSP
jgi:hypothetical protein